MTNAGEIYGNTISGAVVNLAIDGIGDGSIHDNHPYAPVGWAGFFCNSVSANFTAHNYGNASISGRLGADLVLQHSKSAETTV
jgi:hypothetical protein